MRFKVPQNIDMQDRIVGPLTMVQFIYAVIGFGLAYSIYSSMPKPLNLALAAPVAIFVICVDFVKINERPFLNFFLSAIQFLTAPKQRFWQQGDDSDLNVEIYHQQRQVAAVQHKAVSADEIAELAKKMDTGQGRLIRN